MQLYHEESCLNCSWILWDLQLLWLQPLFFFQETFLLCKWQSVLFPAPHFFLTPPLKNLPEELICKVMS